jgi:hypothetical protein
MIDLDIGEDLKKFIIEDRKHPSFPWVNHQWIFRFPNDYGASLITGAYAYGPYEIGVIKFGGSGNMDFALTYSTKLTNDVIGHLDINGVKETLVAISKLRKSRSKKK